MTARELMERWIAYQLEPWGEARADLRMAIQTSALVQMWATKGSKVTPADFLPDFYRHAKRITVKESDPKATEASFRALAAMGVGRIVERK